MRSDRSKLREPRTLEIEVVPDPVSSKKMRVLVRVEGRSLSWAQVLDRRAEARRCKELRRDGAHCKCEPCQIVRAISKYRKDMREIDHVREFFRPKNNA